MLAEQRAPSRAAVSDAKSVAESEARGGRSKQAELDARARIAPHGGAGHRQRHARGSIRGANSSLPAHIRAHIRARWTTTKTSHRSSPTARRRIALTRRSPRAARRAKPRRAPRPAAAELGDLRRPARLGAARRRGGEPRRPRRRARDDVVFRAAQVPAGLVGRGRADERDGGRRLVAAGGAAAGRRRRAAAAVAGDREGRAGAAPPPRHLPSARGDLPGGAAALSVAREPVRRRRVGDARPRARGGGGHLAAGGRRRERRRKRRQRRRRQRRRRGRRRGRRRRERRCRAEQPLAWPGGWLLGALFVAVALRCARQLRETFPPRASHTLLIKRATHAALEERADEQKPIKRTISNLFLRRQTEELEPSATELGPDSSAIARITSAFRRCAAPADGGGVPASAASPPASPGGGDARGYEIMVGPLLDAFPTLVTVGVALGPSFFLLVKNDEGNLVKARRAWSRLSEESVGAEARCATLRGLLEAEVATGVHQTGGVLGDPSAAIAVLWLRRTLQFLLHVLGGLCAGSRSDGGGGGGGSPSRASPLKIEPEQDFKEMVRTAYAGAPRALPRLAAPQLLRRRAQHVAKTRRAAAEARAGRGARAARARVRPRGARMHRHAAPAPRCDARALRGLDLEDLRKAPWI